MFADNKNVHCALGPALLVAEKLLVRDELTLFTSTASSRGCHSHCTCIQKQASEFDLKPFLEKGLKKRLSSPQRLKCMYEQCPLNRGLSFIQSIRSAVFNFLTSLSSCPQHPIGGIGSQCCSPLNPLLDQELSAKRQHHLELLKE